MVRQLESVPTVEIDPDGTFKYILVLVLRVGGAEHQDIIRGTAAAEFHNHIFEKVTGRDCEPGTHIVVLGISGGCSVAPLKPPAGQWGQDLEPSAP
uniref:Uncharacterized protein n=1 Tax=Gopherus evgoodei TaxID=1825980 RepID=A0A8C4WML2_9SAUR